ncbi:MAG: GNAT family N-acetyltransferase [Propionibacteriaceae bacterium]
MITHGVDMDRGQVLAFIAAQQESLITASAFLGRIDQDLEADLEGLDQPWLETLRVCCNDSGQITGAACVEWDEEVDSSWIYGPWCTEETWQNDAPGLITVMLEQASVSRHSFYGAVQNVRFAALAEKLGWHPSCINYEMAIARQALAQPADDVHIATPNDCESLTDLHHKTFPKAYANATQLLDKAGAYTTLVLRDGNRIVGYITGKEDGGDAYVDFLAVDENLRRQGVGTKLLSTFAAMVPGDRVRLTCSEKDTDALLLYRALGFEELSMTRSYNLTLHR